MHGEPVPKQQSGEAGGSCGGLDRDRNRGRLVAMEMEQSGEWKLFQEGKWTQFVRI